MSAVPTAAGSLGLGALLVPLLVLVVRRRVWRPLHELEAGLAQVADGDLTVSVPVRRSDELGRLAEHFNAMTRVLRDRAEEQGRFAAAGELLAGVAHEVNNPLMAIAAHAENRLADPAFEGEQRSEMTQILRQARRATKLLRGLLRFVRATAPWPPGFRTRGCRWRSGTTAKALRRRSCRACSDRSPPPRATAARGWGSISPARSPARPAATS